MNCEITVALPFKRSLKRLSKHYKSLKEDYARFLEDLKENPLLGKELGNHLRKIRFTITSKHKGKSGGARVITYSALITPDKVKIVLLDIYDKSEKETMTDKELQKLMAEIFTSPDFPDSADK